MVARGLLAGFAGGATFAAGIAAALGHGDALLPARGGADPVAADVASAAPRQAVSASAAPAVTRRPVPGGFRRRSVPEARLEIAVPPRWTVLTRRDATFPGVIETLTRVDGSLRTSLVGLTVPDSPLKLFGFDRRSVGRTVTFSLLLGEAAPAGGFARWSVTVRRDIERLSTLRGTVRAGRVMLPAGEALRLEYRRLLAPAGRASVVSTVQYVLVLDGRLVTLVFVAPPTQLRAYAPTFRAAAHTLTFR
jgi:hypothetical protein